VAESLRDQPVSIGKPSSLIRISTSTGFPDGAGEEVGIDRADGGEVKYGSLQRKYSGGSSEREQTCVRTNWKEREILAKTPAVKRQTLASG
jgi:hypothetical protein